jgi:hypothetical protein
MGLSQERRWSKPVENLGPLPLREVCPMMQLSAKPISLVNPFKKKYCSLKTVDTVRK